MHIPESQIQFLRESALFSALDDLDLPIVAEAMVTVELPAGETLFSAYEERDGLFLVESGKLQGEDGRSDKPVFYQRGDLIGLGSPAYPQGWNETVVAGTKSHLWFISSDNLAALSERSPAFAETLTVLASSHELIRTIPKPWLETDERVSLITRKHPIFLFGAVLRPLVFFIVVVAAISFLKSGSPMVTIFGMGAGFLISALWLAWNINNWANDFYLITSKRMVWVERISGYYESRQEAPLGTLISVGLMTSQMGALLGFSDVIVRTYIGDIRFERVAHAKTIGKLIESYWARSKHVDLELDAREIRKALRQKFGKEPEEVSAKELEMEYGIENELPHHEISFFEWLFSDFLKVRYESGGTITYRKHWFVLLKKVFLPLVGIVASGGFVLAVLTRHITWLDYAMALTLGFFIMIASLAVLIYRYVDWRNDMFQLTPNQVIDLDRKPFGRESRRAAPLENILSIEYERKGIFPMLFNYGTVYITIGNSQLTFNNVYQPSVVQQDIFARMGTHAQEKEERHTVQERERIAQWFKVFQEEYQAEMGAQDATVSLNPPSA